MEPDAAVVVVGANVVCTVEVVVVAAAAVEVDGAVSHTPRQVCPAPNGLVPHAQ